MPKKKIKVDLYLMPKERKKKKEENPNETGGAPQIFA